MTADVGQTHCQLQEQDLTFSGLDMAGAVLAASMLIGPLALAPANGPFVPPRTAQKVNEATTGEPNPLNQPAAVN